MAKRDISTDPANLKAMWRKAQIVYNELKSSGLSDVAIAAILGNIAQESAFNPNAGTGKYSGYIQNQKEIVNWIKKNFGGYAHSHLMKYLLAGLTNKLPETTSLWGKELNKRFNDFINGLTNAITVGQATKLWESSYEKSGGLQLLKRINYANYFYKLILNNKNKKKSSKLTEETNLTLNNLYNLLFPEYTSQNEEPQKSIDEVKTDFDLPLLATQFRNGGKLIKKHQYGGTLASRYIQRYFDPNNPLLTYVNFGDAQKAGVLFTNDINNPESGWYFSYDIAKDLQGKDNNNREFRNNIGGYIVNPTTTYAAIDKNGRIINTKDFNVVVNEESLIPTNGYVFDETRGWIPGLPASNGLIIDLDMLDLAEQAARFLSDRGFEHVWRMTPEERISFARSVQESDAAGEAAIFGSLIPKAATSAYNWMTGTNAGRAFTSSMLAGEAIDAGSRTITGQSYGDYMASQYGGNPFLWGLTNPGYLAGEGLVAPIKETLKPVVKETSKTLTERIIQASKNLFNKDYKGQLDYAFEETAMPSSSDLKTKIEAATKYINLRLSQGYKNSKIYTPEEATSIQDLLAAEGIDIKATDNATLIGHTSSKNAMNSIIHRLLNYRLFNFYEPVLPFDNTIKDGKLIDFRIPKQTYFVLDKDGNLVLTTTRSGKLYSDDIIEWPTFLADFPKRKLKGLFLSNGGSRVAFNFVPLEKPFAARSTNSTTRHEVLGHGMNDIARTVMDKETGIPYLSELDKILNGLNPEVLRSMKQFFSSKMNERELQALLKLTWDPVIRDIGRLEGISPQQMEQLSKNNIEKLQALFEEYVDNATPQQLYAWLDAAGSSYASFVKRLLPVEKGLADALENNVDTYDLLLDMVVDNLRRKKVSYTTEDSNKFMNELKHALKKGFSIALPTSATLYETNQQNN